MRRGWGIDRGGGQGTFRRGLVCLPAHSTQARARRRHRGVTCPTWHVARRCPCNMPSAGGSPHEACTRACLDHIPLYSPTVFACQGARRTSQRAAGCLGSPCARNWRDLKCCSYLIPRFSRAFLCSEGRGACVSPISVNFCPWSRLIRRALSLSLSPPEWFRARPGGPGAF